MTVEKKEKFKKQRTWTLEKIRSGLQKFFQEHGRYPTAPEVDRYIHLPSARTIERNFGGLVALRTKLGLDTQADFRTGNHSAKRAETINKRNNQLEQKVYDFLVKRYGKEFVHREYMFAYDMRTRADFFVYDSKKGFCVDIFYPSNLRNITGCLNSKLNKYKEGYMSKNPVIFLQMNEDIKQETLNALVRNKKKSLSSNQYLMDWETFEAFCNGRIRLNIDMSHKVQA